VFWRNLLPAYSEHLPMSWRQQVPSKDWHLSTKPCSLFPEECVFNSALISDQWDTLVGEFHLPVCILHLLCRVESSVWSVAMKWHCHVVGVISWVIR
jgi:hypothetical protein